MMEWRCYYSKKYILLLPPTINNILAILNHGFHYQVIYARNKSKFGHSHIDLSYESFCFKLKFFIYILALFGVNLEHYYDLTRVNIEQSSTIPELWKARP